jgi:uncharacterized protein YgiM (DUF1202 family)
LVDNANKATQLTKDLADKSAELDTLTKTSVAKEVTDLLAKGIADKKLTKDLSDKLSVSFGENPSALKDLIDAMPAQISVVEGLANKDLSADLADKSWDDLYASDKLETVRNKFPDLYAKLRKEKYPNLKD